ncbi:hypothetical protein B0T14DRAFT_596281 [Immersiella caudata]|uniref:Uncharacterized protein n=1 Tax=Immersiella caudata TaxID=314043 RepID=A0AA39TZU4_9PEZI|nr:hypothetical protein B0T14DRAFT_596281 [Immersiella caudata]
MFRWYRDAEVCYAYLPDVTEHLYGNFANVRWFTRGRTLQEMIAPQHLEFYASNWTHVGSKSSPDNWIFKITEVPNSVLETGSLFGTPMQVSSSKSVPRTQSMSWASSRKTIRVEEDTDYCLMGLFNIHMPMLYGEGDRASFGCKRR